MYVIGFLLPHFISHAPIKELGSFFKSSLDNIMIIAMLLWIVDWQLVTACRVTFCHIVYPVHYGHKAAVYALKLIVIGFMDCTHRYGGNTSSIPVWRL